MKGAIIDLKDLKKTVPSAFRTKKQGAIGASEHYQFMTTMDVVDCLGKMGWHLIEAKQPNARKNIDATKHLLRFRNNTGAFKKVGDRQPEILFKNSHDRTSAMVFHVGIFRLVCANGLVVADRTFDELRVRHMGTTFETVQGLIGDIMEKIPTILTTINKFEGIHLNDRQAEKFAMDAFAVRFPEYVNETTHKVDYKGIKENVDIKTILEPMRKQDEGDTLWLTMNRVQEHLLRGGFHHIGKQTTANVRPAREIKDMNRNIKVNQGIWTLADALANKFTLN